MMSWHNDKGMGYKMSAREVIVLINDIWDKSYNQINLNLQAISAQGWKPSNCKLLLHPELVNDLITEESGNTTMESLNSDFNFDMV